MQLKNDMIDNLEPYTEEYRNLSQNIANCDKPTDKHLKDNMERKELNLCEILKGCEGVEFYSLMHGKVRFMGVDADGFVVFDLPESISVYDNGRYDLHAEVIIYPSRVLYEKYPLDAYSAWMEWKELRKPKRWRAKQGEIHWFIEATGEASKGTDNYYSDCDECWMFGNYFRTAEEAKQAAKAVRETLEKFHENHTEQ